MSDHDAPTDRPIDRVGREHLRAGAADAARTLGAFAHTGMLATLTDRPPGYPFGSVVSYALDDEGHPLFGAEAEKARRPYGNLDEVVAK